MSGLLMTWASAAALAAPSAQFFDDFHHADLTALKAAGWTVREERGHPGVPGARWGSEGLLLTQQDGQQVLRLSARTNGRPEGTHQTQLCQPRKFFECTYAARIRFSDAPVHGADGDPIIQTFYAVSPLRFDFDPEFSEIDWEYLPNGGWGSPQQRLYGITWQTVRVEPWTAHNQSFERPEVRAGWHTLVVQVMGGQTRWFVDDREVGLHGGRNYPVVPMALSLNLWFSPGGLLPPSDEPRVYQMDVDWVLHARQQAWSPQQVTRQVAQWRRQGVAWRDTLPGPALPSACNL